MKLLLTFCIVTGIGAVASLLTNRKMAKLIAQVITEAGVGIQTLVPEVDVNTFSMALLWQASLYLKGGGHASYVVDDGKIYFFLVKSRQLQLSH